jgi:nucleoside 2-deoxyribosyltransferase
MRCFVIIPFATSFDDVSTAIKDAVAAVEHDPPIQRNRLDDASPLGQITDHLLSALYSCSFCIADLTYSNPNVMWETGYAMALGKPTIIVTQDLSALPFDIRNMRAIGYNRTQLSKTLRDPLINVVRATLGLVRTPSQSILVEDQSRLIIGLGVRLRNLKKWWGKSYRLGTDTDPPASASFI